ncbi:MAG: hypothetical protein U1F35_22745 [Steroidobacteraceae bacterium]
MADALRPLAPQARVRRAYAEAQAIAEEDVRCCEAIGQHGLALLRELAARRPGRSLNVLTHCNAGWLARVDWGTALAPIYAAHDAGLAACTSTDEAAQPGAALTAFELGAHGVPYTLIADNAGGHLMQRGRIDACLVGSDRPRRARRCGEQGRHLSEGPAARDNGVPFYAALPFSTIDWSMEDGPEEIPIEDCSAREVTHVTGFDERGRRIEVGIAPPMRPPRIPPST